MKQKLIKILATEIRLPKIDWALRKLPISSRCPVVLKVALLFSFMGTLIWLVGVSLVATYHSEPITWVYKKSMLSIYWGGDSEFRALRAAEGETWPTKDEYLWGGDLDYWSTTEVPPGFNYTVIEDGRKLRGFYAPAFRTNFWSGRIKIPMGWFLPVFICCLEYMAIRHIMNRRLPGHCIKCKYNLTGNTSGRCPECGTQISNAKPAVAAESMQLSKEHKAILQERLEAHRRDPSAASHMEEVRARLDSKYMRP